MATRAILFDFDGILVRCIGSDFDTWSPKTHLEDLTGNAFDWHDLDAKRQVEIRRDLEGQREMEGAQDCLRVLAAKCIPAAVVSSSSHDWVDGWLDQLELRVHFQTTVCRGDAERIKPAPDLYLEAARRLALKPKECLVIEDSLNGVHSAKAAGMPVWAVPNRVTSCLDFEPADRVFESLSACAEALHGLGGR